ILRGDDRLIRAFDRADEVRMLVCEGLRLVVAAAEGDPFRGPILAVAGALPPHLERPFRPEDLDVVLRILRDAPREIKGPEHSALGHELHPDGVLDLE